MACVNKSSREFKALSAKHNISANTLELITHKYWIEQGKEEGLPSDLYIQAQLGGTKYVEPIKEVRELWNSRYSTPQTYQTSEELDNARTEAQKFFPPQAIVSYQDAQGTYILNVKQPVSSINGNPIADSAMTDKQNSYHVSYWKQRHRARAILESKVRQAQNRIEAYSIIGRFNRQYHTNFGMSPDHIVDRISQKYKDLITEENMEATSGQMGGLRDFLMTLFPYMDVHIMSEVGFNDFLSDYGLNPYAECCVINNHVIIPRNLNSADYLLEEFLHPLIEILYNDRRSMFDAMLQEAKKDFSLLEYQINESYRDSESDGFDETVRQKELVTQALSRYFRESLGKNKNTHKGFKYFVNKFIKFVQDMFNFEHEPEFKKTSIGTRMIPISSLKDINSLAELADALNTEGISFDTRKGFKKGKVTYHVTSANFDETKYETEKLDEHRTAIYRKQDYIDLVNGKGEVVATVPYELWKESKNPEIQSLKTYEEFEKKYGENAELLYNLAHEWTTDDISDEATEQKYKQDRLEAVYDDREGELLPELAFFNGTINQQDSRSDNMDETFSETLQTAITTGNWTEEAKQELDNIINQIEDGTITYKRFPQEASRGFHRGGRIHEAASIILKRSGETGSTKSLSFNERYERDKRQQPVQEKIIEDWARSLIPEQKWDRYAPSSKEGYEVSLRGDKRFSALKATFKQGTVIDGVDVSGRTIEDVYQHVIKKSSKGKEPASDSKVVAWNGYFEGGGRWITDDYPNLPKELVEKMEDSSFGAYNLTRRDKEDISYYMGYLPLWQEWAKQNPQLIRELQEKAKGKYLTDKFANTRASQARALAEIINSFSEEKVWFDNLDEAVKSKKQIGEGGEAKVFYDGNGVVRKLITTEYFITPQFALDRITLHNTLFPEAPLTLRGFGKNEKEEFVFVVDQPFIEGTTPSMTEIHDFMEKSGFKKQGDKGNTYTNESIYLSDLHDENVIKTPQGNLVVIDVDARLNTAELGKGGNYQIDNSIQSVFSQTSQQEEEKVEEKKAVEEEAPKDKYGLLNKQFNNLLDNDIISQQEIQHVAEQVADYISDLITKYQKDNSLIHRDFDFLPDANIYSHLSRKELINKIGINNLLDRAKQHFSSFTDTFGDMEQTDQAELIMQNWDAVVAMSSAYFTINEGQAIRQDFQTKKFTVQSSSTIDFDNFEESRDYTTVREEEGDSQEYWQVESRTIDVLSSMSQLVKSALHECYLLDADGNLVTSKWGIPERVNIRNATNSILRWTQGSLSLQDMIDKLQEKKQSAPWLTPLIERLSNTDGTEADFQSQFYTVFQKSWQSYHVVKQKEGQFTIIPCNSHPALTEIMQDITALFKMNNHPLFNNGYIKKQLLGSAEEQHPSTTLHSALTALQALNQRYIHKDEITEEQIQEAVQVVSDVCKILGYDSVKGESLKELITAENVNRFAEALRYIVSSLDKQYTAQHQGTSKESYDPFKYYGANNIASSIRNFLTPITDKLEDTTVSSFYDNGKMYQSYVTPSFMTLLMSKFHQEGEQLEEFINEMYAHSEWFKNKGNFQTGWRNEWLRLLATEAKSRQIFDHTVMLNVDGKPFMKKMSDVEYALGCLSMYFLETANGSQPLVPAWYRVPLLSNKPSAEFLKFWSYRGENYKEEIVNGLYKVFLQEVSRIQTVLMRNKTKQDPDFIKNFDKKGRLFNFMPDFNAYLKGGDASQRTLLQGDDNSRFASLLQQKIQGDKALTSEENSQLQTYIKEAIGSYMNTHVEQQMANFNNLGITNILTDTSLSSVKNMGKTEEEILKNLENFIWNDKFAAINIMEITIGDPAFYKDSQDITKRIAQLHSPGIRANLEVKDYKGNRVSDGYYRTVVLQDFDTYKSNLIDNLTIVLDRKIQNAAFSEREYWQQLKERLVGEQGAFRDINASDAQGYTSPSAYRKKALMFGRWSQGAEFIYQKLKNGDYTFTDLEIAFQPLKPFVYSQLYKNIGAASSPITTMNVAFQAKNSEYLLIMADALLQGENTGKPNLLHALYEVMEDSEKKNPTRGIDTIQFNSAIKSGEQGVLDISQFDSTQAVKTYIENLIYKKDANGSLTTEYDTDTYVQTTSYLNYCIQQEVPEHFKEHSQTFGSQVRMTTPSDLPMYKDPNGDRTSEDNIIWYEWDEPDGTHRKVTAEQYHQEYEQTIADNIEESIQNCIKMFHLGSFDKKQRNQALSEILQKEILNNPRYPLSMLQAVQVDENGEFRIPISDFTQSKRIEQLINSVIKSEINNQKIAGGPIVQVSNYGTSRQLQIRFKDKDGNTLPTREEWQAKNPTIPTNPNDPNDPYNAYLKENQRGIAYYEVFAPIWSNGIFEKFANEDGTIDIEAIEMCDPELLYLIGYRIPTEAKYSIAPLKIVGFLPREAGDAIMLPYEITKINDSDFDIDKEYAIRKELPVITRPKGDIVKSMLDMIGFRHPNQNLSDISVIVKKLVSNPEKYRNATPAYKVLYDRYYKKCAYTTKPPLEGKLYRDNKIFDMSWAVYTHEEMVDQMLNPGGFDNLLQIGYGIAAYKALGGTQSVEGLSKEPLDDLKKLSSTPKDLTWIGTQLLFYKQASAAASLIGISAVNKIAHAILEHDHLYVDISSVCDPFAIAGHRFQNLVAIDEGFDFEQNLISKTLGSYVGASADAVKEPVFDLVNINEQTVNPFFTLLRMGVPEKTALKFLSANILFNLVQQYSQNSLKGSSMENLINTALQKFEKELGITDTSSLKTEEVTEEDLDKGLLGTDSKVSYKILLTFAKLMKVYEVIQDPNFVTRFNSIRNAPGPLVLDNLIREKKINDFNNKAFDSTPSLLMEQEGQYLTATAETIFGNHPILRKFSQAHEVARGVLHDATEYSDSFTETLQVMPQYILDILFKDKELLSKFSDFYKTYSCFASGMIDSKHLRNYIEGFPKYFIKEREKYKDNPFIEAIRVSVPAKTNHPELVLNVAGLDGTYISQLEAAWTDFHKQNPQLSTQLFTYWVFKEGIGFSPKTPLGIAPIYVKEHLTTKTSYKDTLKDAPMYSVSKEAVIDSFIRHNSDSYKLVPTISMKDRDKKVMIDYAKGQMVIFNQTKEDGELPIWVKTSSYGSYTLWRQLPVKVQIEGQRAFSYEQIDPLGNNHEYFEISVQQKDFNSFAHSDTFKDNKYIQDNVGSALSEAQQQKRLDDKIDEVMGVKGQIERKDGLKEAMKSHIEQVAKDKNIDLDIDKIEEENDKLC